MDMDDAVLVQLTRDGSGIIRSVEPGIRDLLGWEPEQLVGSPSTQLIHPDDQSSAIAAWMEMVTEPGGTRVWRGRYRAADGSWTWVETVNENHLEDASIERVLTTMRRVERAEVSVEEELRARKQLLNRLSDALPVGLLQLDRHHALTFTNDRLHAILEAPPAATVEAQLAGVVAEDRDALQDALASVLADEPVDDMELRLTGGRVCLLSLRPLTDSDGAVSGAIGCLTDVTESVQLRRELQIRASVDELTGLLNRSAILQLLSLQLPRRVAAGAGLAVAFVDLDHFKDVNDERGHAAGDRLLVAAATLLRAAIRDGDEVGRLGGDEFLAVCPQVSSEAQAQEIGDRLSRTLTATIDLGDSELALHASVGVAWTDEVVTADELVARADAAMYESKRVHGGAVLRRAS
jgi:diguanylate cyclase (GGDEF)-like protein/PAS domain S-box-containing protein